MLNLYRTWPIHFWTFFYSNWWVPTGNFAAPRKLPKVIMDNGQIILPAYALENFL